eukprot:scaffold6805_cov59-Isochrysis_galbana.AAC.3
MATPAQSPFTPAGGAPFTPAGGAPFTPAGGAPFTAAGGAPFTAAGGGAPAATPFTFTGIIRAWPSADSMTAVPDPATPAALPPCPRPAIGPAATACPACPAAAA